MAIHIWYVSKYVAPPGSGSAGGRGFSLMRQFVRMGHTSTIITSDSNHLIQPPRIDRAYHFQSIDHVEICWVNTIKYQYVKSLRRILSWLHFEWRLLFLPRKKLAPPSVIIVSSLSLLTILNGLRWRWIYKCPLIFEVRDIWPLTLVEEGGYVSSSPLILLLSFLEWVGYKYSDAIVGTMPNLSMHVEEVLGCKRNTFCIPMGIEESDLSVFDEEPIVQNLPLGKFVVAHVGSIGATNALGTLFECADLMQENTAVHFLLVGDGDLRDMYQRRYGYLANVTFLPRVPKTTAQSILRRCSLLYFAAHPSKVWEYGQSLNKVIDYMLSGRPVVASYSGYPSMINEAKCGCFVSAQDPRALSNVIIQFCQMSERQRQLIGGRGRDWLRANRSYSKLAAEYYLIISSLCFNSRDRAH